MNRNRLYEQDDKPIVAKVSYVELLDKGNYDPYFKNTVNLSSIHQELNQYSKSATRKS